MLPTMITLIAGPLKRATSISAWKEGGCVAYRVQSDISSYVCATGSLRIKKRSNVDIMPQGMGNNSECEGT